MKKMFTLIAVLALSAALLIGCAAAPKTASIPQPSEEINTVQAEPAELLAAEPKLTGGVLCLKINPEIALHYDENGKVTKLEGRNGDGTELLKGFTDYTGKDTTQVLEELVEIIGKAGYFVEEADGTARRIVLELDPGSQVPHEQFLQDMAQHVKACVESKNWVGEREYDYPEQTTTAPAVQKPAENTAPATVPVNLCPVCGDDDCDDGKYCDDWDEKAENLREAENRKNGVSCSVCGDYDCDDGKYCDDWDDRYDDDHHDDHHDRDDWDD